MDFRDSQQPPWPDPPPKPSAGARTGSLKLGTVLKFGLLLIIAAVAMGYILQKQTPAPDQALDKAVLARDIEAARNAIALGANVNRADATGSTPLHSAAWRGDVAMARLLVEHGALVDRPDARIGETPLHSAARGDHPDMAAYLLARGADPSRRTHTESPQCNGFIYPAGSSALDIARQSGYEDLARALEQR